jgi:hypothetical protein
LGESSFLLFFSIYAAFSVQTDAVMNNSGLKNVKKSNSFSRPAVAESE